MCGEHEIGMRYLSATTGSSPHVRGAHADQGGADGFRGIIPACAGSTVFPSFGSSGRRDHPRMCGEHSEATA